MQIRVTPIFNDNYTFLLIDEEAGVCAAVDPADAAVAAEVIEDSGARLTHILCTHHHWDHSGGNEALLARYPDAVVVGSAREADEIPGIGQRVDDGDVVEVGRLTGRVLSVPCHTRGHVAYLFDDALFCGDVLFVGGCGRFFEGDAADMHRALNVVLASLPPETRVYCGHEYTVSNLTFARTLEPDNEALREKLAWAKAQRAADRPTIPSTIGQELTYNPFMRVAQRSVQRAVGATDPVEVMARVRERKNNA